MRPPQRGVFVGLTTVDIVLRVPEHPAHNAKTVATGRALCAGGPAANAAVAFVGLGGHAALVSALGTSPLAWLARNELKGCGVAVHDAAAHRDDPPPLAVVLSDASDGTRSVVLSRDELAHRSLLPPPERVLDGVAVVLLDGHHPDLALPLAHAARERGIPTVLDAGSWKPVLAELLPHIDYAVASADFAPDAEGALDRLLSLGAGCAAVSAGPDPIRWRDADGSRGSVDVPSVAVIDTLGAGDVLHGAFCWFLAGGADFPEALRLAAIEASAHCEVLGRR